MTFRLLSPAPAAALAMATIATAAAFDIDASLTLSDPSHIVTVGEDAMIQNDINAASPVIPHDSSATSKEAAVHLLRLKNTDEDDGRVLKYRPKNLRLTAAVSSYDSSKELGILHGTPAQSSFDSYSDGFGVGVRHRELDGHCDDDDDIDLAVSVPQTLTLPKYYYLCVTCGVEEMITVLEEYGQGRVDFFDINSRTLLLEVGYDLYAVPPDYITGKLAFTIPCPPSSMPSLEPSMSSMPSSMPSMNPAMPSKAAKKTKAAKAAKGTKAPKAPKAE